MNKEQLNIIKSSLAEVALREEAEISRRILFAEAPSEAFLQRLDDDVKRVTDEVKRHVTLKKAIAIIIAAALIIAAMTVSIYAIREKSGGLLVKFLDGNASLTVDSDTESPDINRLKVKYLPDGYVYSWSLVDSSSANYIYYKGEKYMTICFDSKSGTYTVSTQNNNFSSRELDGITVYTSENRGADNTITSKNAYWAKYDVCCSIHCPGDVSDEEIDEIIRNIVLEE